MIIVDINENSISITGHADYADSGYDIVCAAVSALTNTLIESIRNLTNDGLNVEEYDLGNVQLKLEKLSDATNTLIDSFFIGVKLIADKYPENVSLNKLNDQA